MTQTPNLTPSLSPGNPVTMVKFVCLLRIYTYHLSCRILSEKSNFSLGGGISMICFSLLL